MGEPTAQTPPDASSGAPSVPSTLRADHVAVDGAVPATRRRPRLRFLVLGTVVAAALGVGLFTGIGAGAGSGTGHRPVVGSQAPTFVIPRLGGGTVGDPPPGTGPVVLLFFGSWCPSCHGELPPLAAAVRHQRADGGPLARARVVGVDSYDSAAAARSFTRSAGVGFAVGLDSQAQVTNGLYYFTGDPEAVVIDPSGTITAIRYGPIGPALLDRLVRAA